ncbi:MAG: zinc-ribbon domain-containing protein [Lachnospiraceae bacterium]
MICRNCGNELKDTDTFCTSCGTKVVKDNALNTEANSESIAGNQNVTIPNNVGRRKFIFESGRSGIFSGRKCYTIESDEKNIYYGNSDQSMEIGNIKTITYKFQAAWLFGIVAAICLPLMSIILAVDILYGIITFVILAIYAVGRFHRKIVICGNGLLNGQMREREIVIYSESEKDMLEFFDYIKRNPSFKGSINKGINIPQIVMISCSLTISVLLLLIMVFG